MQQTYTPDQYINNRPLLKEKLLRDGSVGLDLSPGDPVAFAAYLTINALEAEIAALKNGRIPRSDFYK